MVVQSAQKKEQRGIGIKCHRVRGNVVLKFRDLLGQASRLRGRRVRTDEDASAALCEIDALGAWVRIFRGCQRNIEVVCQIANCRASVRQRDKRPGVGVAVTEHSPIVWPTAAVDVEADQQVALPRYYYQLFQVVLSEGRVAL